MALRKGKKVNNTETRRVHKRSKITSDWDAYLLDDSMLKEVRKANKYLDKHILELKVTKFTWEVVPRFFYVPIVGAKGQIEVGGKTGFFAQAEKVEWKTPIDIVLSEEVCFGGRYHLAIFKNNVLVNVLTAIVFTKCERFINKNNTNTILNPEFVFHSVLDNGKKPNANGDICPAVAKFIKVGIPQNISMGCTCGPVTCSLCEKDEKMDKCTHPQVERVVRVVNDHSVEENKWVCTNCGATVATLETIDSLKPIHVSDALRIFEYKEQFENTNDSIDDMENDIAFIKENIESALKLKDAVSYTQEEQVEYLIRTNDKHEMKMLLKTTDAYACLSEFENWLRSEWKHNEDGYSEEQHEILGSIRDKFYIFVGDHNLDLDEWE